MVKKVWSKKRLVKNNFVKKYLVKKLRSNKVFGQQKFLAKNLFFGQDSKVNSDFNEIEVKFEAEIGKTFLFDILII